MIRLIQITLALMCSYLAIKSVENHAYKFRDRQAQQTPAADIWIVFQDPVGQQEGQSRR